ncbi:Cache 3/Cache 2 fusion domain-containing protein [Paraburkholderia sp. LEh10]|uniref:Cache 3/Cache 2 fusion domain-containing protein n=1 Tax=Paraburkholderia sp. LEh10 TaxID=2821353 RepID=UPI001AE5C4DF|nr:Cache 3/Cache 2 fusion domain-containing protein [Paraburkholderia sp. LEh10]MBP0592060.1 Cache 3/Cache 2 fusion domain-containing protein [Paraburkholderia sp. LEh10]
MFNRTHASHLRRLVLLTLCAMATSAFVPQVSRAQSPESVKQAMTLLKNKTAKLGAPAVKGEDAIAGKEVPALYFGATKMNNNFAVVDEVKKEMGSTATLFVKSGDDFVRVATNVQKDDGSRAIGTILDPKGKAIAAIRTGSAYYGDADILGKPYVTGYEPIHDASGTVIGIYYVGYPKTQ